MPDYIDTRDGWREVPVELTTSHSDRVIWYEHATGITHFFVREEDQMSDWARADMDRDDPGSQGYAPGTHLFSPVGTLGDDRICEKCGRDLNSVIHRVRPSRRDDPTEPQLNFGGGWTEVGLDGRSNPGPNDNVEFHTLDGTRRWFRPSAE